MEEQGTKRQLRERATLMVKWSPRMLLSEILNVKNNATPLAKIMFGKEIDLSPPPPPPPPHHHVGLEAHL